MSDLVLGIRLTADGSGLVGEVRVSQAEIARLGQVARQSNTEAKSAAEQFTASLKKQADTLGMTKTQVMAYGASQQRLSAAQRDSVAQSILAIEHHERMERVLTRVKYAAAAAGAAIGAALVAALKQSVTLAAQAEQSHLRLEAVLKATGYAAGLTKGELDAMAESMKVRLGIDDDALRDAMAVLLRFRNVSRQSFGEALEVAANLAAVMRTDLQSAVLQLGKALEDPEQGLTALSRSGVSFSDTQRGLIKQMVETGRQGEAITLILKTMKEQGLDGVAQSMNQGLTKATRDLGHAWDDLLKALGKTETVGGQVQQKLGLLSDWLQNIKNTVESGDWVDQVLGVATLGLRQVPPRREEVDPGKQTVDDWFARRGLADQKRRERREQMIREQAEDEAAWQKELEAWKAKQKRPAARTGYVEDYSASRRDANMAEEERMLQQLRETGFFARDAAGQRWLEDERKAYAELQGLQSRHNAAAVAGAADLVAQTKAIRAGLIDDERERAQALLNIEAEKWASLIEQAEEGTRARQELELAFVDWYAAQQARIAKEHGDLWSKLGDAVEGWTRQATDAIADFAMTGELDFRRLANAIIADLIRIQIQTSLTGPLAGAVGAFFEGLFSGGGGSGWVSGYDLLHGGGVAGRESSGRRLASPAIFEGAPRLHGGGLVPGEVPAILRRGEGVFTPEQMRALGGQAVNVQVNIATPAGTQGRVERREQPDGTLVLDVIVEQIDAALARNVSRGAGALAGALSRTYGLSRTVGAYR